MCFFFLIAETFREYKSANNPPTLQGRDQQKVTFWEVTCFCLNSSRPLMVHVWPTFPRGSFLENGDMNGKSPLGHRKSSGNCGMPIVGWILACESVTWRKEIGWHMLAFYEILWDSVNSNGGLGQVWSLRIWGNETTWLVCAQCYMLTKNRNDANKIFWVS